jgi:hypothetical protein
VGTASAGLANPGNYVDIDDGYFVFIPTATPVMPATGSNWDHDGVVPDLTISDGQDALNVALAAALEQLALSPRNPRHATEIEWGLEWATSQLGVEPMSDRQARAYSGVYDDVYSVTAAGNQVRFANIRSGSPARNFIALGNDRFADPLRTNDRRYVFERNARGQVTALMIEGNGRSYFSRRLERD